MREFCPACGSKEKVDSFVVNGYDIKCCLDCNSMYVGMLPTSEELAEIYTSDSYYTLSSDSMQRIVNENTRRMALIRTIKPNGSFLDIGCAHGLLLDAAKNLGFETNGVEPTLKNAEVAQAKGHSIFNGWLNDFVEKNGDKRFDVITCLDVIEHIDNPQPFLRLATSLLKDDGLMVVSTPNYSGFIAKILGAKDPYMTPPEHVTFFTIDGMKKLSDLCNLKVKKIKSFGSLIPSEMERSIDCYIPKQLRILSPVIIICVTLGFKILNWARLGLEQELYLNKKSLK